MEPFLKAFFTIDRDHSDSITQAELQEYVKRNNLNHSMIARWNTLFDTNHSGVITLEEFCRVLGLQLSEVRRMRPGRSPDHSNTKEVDIITVTLPSHIQQAIVDHLRQHIRGDKFDEGYISKELKRFLDDRFDRMWQVVISRTSLWSSFSYEPNTSFFFHFRKHIFLVWKNSD